MRLFSLGGVWQLIDKMVERTVFVAVLLLEFCQLHVASCKCREGCYMHMYMYFMGISVLASDSKCLL